MKIQKNDRDHEHDVEVLDHEVAGLDQEDGHRRQGDAEVVEDRLELRDDEVEDEADDHAGDEDDHDRVDHRRLDPPLERLRLLLEVGQALEDRLERTAGLAGLDHVAVEPVERLGVLGERLGEGRAALDVLDDVAQRVLEHARLALALEDLEAPQDRQAGVLERRELAGERAELLGRDLADRERLLLPPALLLRRRPCPPSALVDRSEILVTKNPFWRISCWASSWVEASIVSLTSRPVWSIASY